MRRAWEFGRLFLFAPSRAADSCARKAALGDGLRVYAFWVAASLAYLWLKPYNFPDANAPLPTHAGGFGFWLRVAAWEPLLAALNIALTALALNWMRDGWLPLKTAVATLWSAAPLILTIAYTKVGLSRAAFGAGMIAWAAPGAWAARRVAAEEWRKIAGFLLGLNALSLALLIPEIAATLLRSDFLYKTSLGLNVAALLVCGGVGLRRLYGISIARAVLALLFANIVLNLAVAAAYLLRWLPMEVLKILVYV